MSVANQEAENRKVRRDVWGSDLEVPMDDDMGDQTILGDVTHPTPIVIAGNQSGGSDLLKGLAIAALGAAIPGAAIAGYFVSQAMKDQSPIVAPNNPDGQNDFSVGLGKITDYLDVAE